MKEREKEWREERRKEVNGVAGWRDRKETFHYEVGL